MTDWPLHVTLAARARMNLGKSSGGGDHLVISPSRLAVSPRLSKRSATLARFLNGNVVHRAISKREEEEEEEEEEREREREEAEKRVKRKDANDTRELVEGGRRRA